MDIGAVAAAHRLKHTHTQKRAFAFAALAEDNYFVECFFFAIGLITSIMVGE